MAEELIGEVSDFFAHPVVAGIELTGKVKVGDNIVIRGHTTDLKMTVESLQVEHESVPEAKKGDSIGIKVKDRVRVGDKVYKVTE